MSARCYFASGVPAGISDVAEEGWGVNLNPMWYAAHRRFKNHDDGAGRCRVCGCPIDFEAWMDTQDDRPTAEGADG